jgi:hypothetical protein
MCRVPGCTLVVTMHMQAYRAVRLNPTTRPRKHYKSFELVKKRWKCILRKMVCLNEQSSRKDAATLSLVEGVFMDTERVRVTKKCTR